MASAETILKRNPRYINRRKELEPLAVAYSIDPAAYKNRTLLVDAIKRCVGFANTCDPVTLEPISSISDQYRIEWEQDGKRYCADVGSLYAMISTGNTINPWAIDCATGVLQASDSEQYNKRFDMAQVVGLFDAVHQKAIDLGVENRIDQNVPSHITQRHEIEKCGHGLYITHVIDTLEKCSVQRAAGLIHNAIVLVHRQCVLQAGIEGEITDTAIYLISALEQLTVGNSLLVRSSVHTTGLGFASDMFSRFKGVLSDTVIEQLFEYIDKQNKEMTRA